MARRIPTPTELGWASAEQPGGVRLMRAAALFPVVVIVLAIASLEGKTVMGGPLVIGLGLASFATLLTFTTAFSRFASWVMLVIPLLDLGAVSTFHLIPGADAVGVLAAVPGMWLGGIFRWRGVAVVAVASTVGFAVLGQVGNGTWLGAGSHAASLVLVTTLSSVLIVFVVELTTSQMLRLQEQGALLSESAEVANHQRQHVGAIVGAVDVGLGMVGTDGTYISMNPRHRELLGLVFPGGHSGFVGQMGYVYAADNTTPLGRDDLPSVRAARGESFSDITLWIGKEPADRRAVAASARQIRDEDGTCTGAVLAFHDITDLMLALRVKGDFVARVSHELRTPLTSIMGYLELMEEFADDLPPEVVDYLGIASRNADRLLRLVSDLLSAGSSGRSTVQLLLEPFDLAALVHRSVEDLSHTIHGAGLDLVLDIEPILDVVADSGRLTQVFDHLLSNAIKYNHQGGAVAVTLARRGSDAYLCVSDTGIGISEVDQTALFTKFFRARTVSEREIQGVGLGLVISKAIVEAHGGDITVTSHEGLGTSVHVTLPGRADSIGPGIGQLTAVRD